MRKQTATIAAGWRAIYFDWTDALSRQNNKDGNNITRIHKDWKTGSTQARQEGK